MKTITLASWLEAITADTKKLEQSILFFHGGDEYPILFFAALHQLMREKRLNIQQVDASSVEWPSIEASIATSFLGHSLLYHLRSLDNLDTKKLKKILPVIFSYKGPHRLMFWMPKAFAVTDSQIIPIAIPDKVDRQLMLIIAKTFGFHRVAASPDFLKMIFSKTDSLSLESAYLLACYGSVLGNDVKSFARDWMDQICDVSPSLFMLSQHFFARDTAAFGSLWQQIRQNYQFPFWMTFWSEQLFRAACVIRYNNAQQVAQAKKMSFRLPFSFLNTGWRHYNYQELMNAHRALYVHDCHIKNGGSEEMLDLFYAQFFAGQFKHAL